MTITIHRGTDQIGGCVTEYARDGWRLFVDYGEQLPGTKKSGPLEVEGLTKGDLSKSALLITHYHGDHIGCISEVSDAVPIYMGKTAREIQLTASKHVEYAVPEKRLEVEKLEKMKLFTPGEPFSFGPFRIMPISMDHLAFDAYAFKIEAGGTKVFHTGDFRAHGFRSGKMEKLLTLYIGEADYVVSEGTNVSRPAATSVTERDLQCQFIKCFREHKYNVVYPSSTNIDRLFSLYHAADKTNRLFIVDYYQKNIMDLASQDPVWGRSEFYNFSGKHKPLVLSWNQSISPKFSAAMERLGYVLIARANPNFNEFIVRIPREKTKYLSMWEGYIKKGSEAYSEALAEALGEDYLFMHTSGHCDMDRLGKVFELLKPKAIIPIHTDNPEVFATTFGNRWQIIRLCDGESFCPA